MSPNLDAIMFNRNENLSTRRPLLPDEGGGRYAPVATAAHQHYDTRVSNNGAVPQRPRRPPPPPAPRPPARDPFDVRFLANRQDSFGKPPIDVRHAKNGYRQYGHEKVTYFNTKLAIPPEGSLDRRETELVFRFDPHSSNDHLGATPGARYLGDAPSPVRFGGGSPGAAQHRLEPPDKDGPFVFGVHSPSQFRIPNRLSDGDYDYANIVDEDAAKTVIKDSEVKCCDRVSDWNTRSRAKSMRVLNRMFQIKDNRCRRKQATASGKKDKIKCVLVGDGAVGKTSLITAYAQNKFRSEYEPTAYDNFNVVVEVDERPVCVEICDTAGQDSMSELRALCYPGTDVLMLCFSVVRPETFRSVAARWVRAVATVRAPLVLVGTQADLARDPHVLNELRIRGEHVVTEAEARALASSINAEYVETSARMRSKLKDAFDSAILAGLPVVATKKPFWKKLFCMN